MEKSVKKKNNLLFFKIKKKIRGIYYKYFAKVKFHTVHLRGGLKLNERNFILNHKNFLIDSCDFFKKSFDNESYNILEIGFGSGLHFEYLGLLGKQKNFNVFGIEMDKVSILKTLKKINDKNLKIKIFNEDARLFIEKVPKKSLDVIFILFPDPWRKKRTHKKRLINGEFLKKVLQHLRDDGKIIIASDWEDYSLAISVILNNLKVSNFIDFNMFDNEDDDNRNIDLIGYDNSKIFETKFALRAIEEGRKIKVFVIRKSNRSKF